MPNHVDVFISSTSKDLLKFRAKVQEVILRSGAYPILMEAFDATERNALQLCYDRVQEAEVFVGIYARRYGFAPDENMQYTTNSGEVRRGNSVTGITELEYEWALERGIPMLLFVVAHQDEDGQELAWQPSFMDTDPQKSRLEQFKERIMSKHVVGFFYSPDQLAMLVQSALHKVMAISQPRKRRDFFTHKPLPTNYIMRPDIMQGLRESLENNLGVAIHGMGGIGKSVMARALCEEPTVQEAFPDGILWVTVGSHPSDGDLVQKLREWIEALGGQVQSNAPTIDSLKVQLADLLKDSVCLLIIDDIWQRKHADIFRMGGEACHTLMTTRDAETARSVGFVVFTVPPMHDTEAVILLKEWAQGALAEVPPTLIHMMSQRLGRLPLALKLAGAQLQKRSPSEWLETFNARKLKSRRAEDIHDSLEQTFGLSLDTLSAEHRRLYVALAIFKEDESIPFVAVHRLWQALAGFEADETQELLEDIIARALCEGDTKNLVIHDLLRDFMTAEIDNLSTLHQGLLSAYQPTQTGEGWHTAPDDGYLYDHLVFHLLEAGDTRALEALFDNAEWFHMRVKQSSYLYDGYIADLMTAWKDVAQSDALLQIERAESPTSLVNCVRYALIRTSLNSIAGNYEAPLVIEAVRSGLEGWTTTRALNISSKITHLERRVLMCASLLEAGFLSSDEAQKAKNIAINAINVIQDTGSWTSTLVSLIPHLTPEERAVFWHDDRLESLTNTNFIALLPYIPTQKRQDWLKDRLNILLKRKPSPTTSSVRDSLQLLQTIPPYLNDDLRQTTLELLESKRTDYNEYSLQNILVALYPTLSDSQRSQALAIADTMTNEEIRERTLALIQDNASPTPLDATPKVPETWLPENIAEAIRSSLKIEDERLVNRAIYNLSGQANGWLPLKPFVTPDKPLLHWLEQLPLLSEEHKAKVIMEVTSKVSADEREKLLSLSYDISDDWYRAIALAAFLNYVPNNTSLIQEIQRALLWFMTKRTTRQREYLLHFLATHILFTPPVLESALTQGIVAHMTDISRWEWL